MSMQLVQKHLLKGTRSFELSDEEVKVHIDMPFLNKEFIVVLSILDPEPVVNGSTLAFVSAVNREPLIEMFVDKPDPESFNAFVEQIKQRAIEEDYGRPKPSRDTKTVNLGQLDIAIDMLKSYLGDEHADFIARLEALKAEPESVEKLGEVYEAFDALGPAQGAILTYAPYVSNLLTDDIPDSRA